MRVLVCGSRRWENTATIRDVLDQIDEKRGIDLVIEGGCGGADWIAEQWALSKGKPVIEMKANFGFYGASGGPIRNRWMIDFAEPDLVVAFPDPSHSPGTRNMINLAKAAGIETMVFEGENK